jgi:hypothetical protein
VRFYTTPAENKKSHDSFSKLFAIKAMYMIIIFKANVIFIKTSFLLNINTHFFFGKRKKHHCVSKGTYIESHNNTGRVLFRKLYGRTKITMHVVI